MNDSKQINKTVYLMRIIAIFSVICAHITINSELTFLVYIKHIFNNIGSVGVGIFFFCSGMYFNYEQKFETFFKKSILLVLPPHVISSSLIYLTLSLYHKDFTILSMLNFIVGNGSIFYFLTDMYIIKLISYFILKMVEDKHHNLIVFISFLINAAFILLESHSVSIFPTPYLNFFIFIFYFYLGILARKYIVNLNNFLNEFHYTLIVFVMQVFILVLFSKYDFSYNKNVFSLIFETLFIISIMCNAYKLSFMSFINAEFVGRNTLFIYLYHLFPIMVINNIGNKFLITQLISFLWPEIVFIIMLLLLYYINKYVNIKLKRIVFGIK